MTISSPAFADGGTIPRKYTCDGANVSPALQWKNVPEKAKSLALAVEDPDAPAGGWTHWVIYNIPAGSHGLSSQMPPTAHAANGTAQGANSFGKTGYGGPCPPSGAAPHHYYFRLYALDAELPPVPDAAALKAALKGHVLAAAALTGRYGRK
ncbi:MAG: YbhB/YbcL family Raf kinase inhibitor-like protein [Alphaproteobacteria bacterium]|nr:YbhB/YbcL family Raf kinase inhibitor-like protein [Alphaproteobacteria bacterium]MDE2336629.1 YbhB/YbcL family Raf kinase inhibitor-like protein [Alphaproteobacteria bacterium]